MVETIRYIEQHELKELLELYRHLNKDDPEPEAGKNLESLWNEILGDSSQHYLVCDLDGKIVAACVLIIVKNLTRGGRPYGLIENVVTHESYRNKGYAKRLLQKALEIAKGKGCYKVMLMTSRGEDVQQFYEKAGFERGKKTGFIVRF